VIFDNKDNLYIYRLKKFASNYWFIKLARTDTSAPYAYVWAKEFLNSAISFCPGQFLVNEKINAVVMGGYLHKWNPTTTHKFAVGLLINGPTGSGSFSLSS
jgi:hypothetical protein